jgi:bisphosphoglycerate-independent phosphoglycerate mutase (AlkP superfamily)
VWSADHCADALEVPGLLCCNQIIRSDNPSLIDLAPSILEDFGLQKPQAMTGRSIFTA